MSKLDKAHRDYEVLNSFSLGNNWGDMETPQHGNASKKQNHKTNLMSSSLNLKLKRLYSNDFHSHGRSARPPSLF